MRNDSAAAKSFISDASKLTKDFYREAESIRAADKERAIMNAGRGGYLYVESKTVNTQEGKEGLEAARSRYTHQLKESANTLMEAIERQSTDAPTEEELRLIETYSARDNLTPEEINNALKRYGGKQSVANALADVASKKKIYNLSELNVLTVQAVEELRDALIGDAWGVCRNKNSHLSSNPALMSDMAVLRIEGLGSDAPNYQRPDKTESTEPLKEGEWTIIWPGEN